MFIENLKHLLNYNSVYNLRVNKKSELTRLVRLIFDFKYKELFYELFIWQHPITFLLFLFQKIPNGFI